MQQFSTGSKGQFLLVAPQIAAVPNTPRRKGSGIFFFLPASPDLRVVHPRRVRQKIHKERQQEVGRGREGGDETESNVCQCKTNLHGDEHVDPLQAASGTAHNCRPTKRVALESTNILRRKALASFSSAPQVDLKVVEDNQLRIQLCHCVLFSARV